MPERSANFRVAASPTDRRYETSGIWS